MGLYILHCSTMKSMRTVLSVFLLGLEWIERRFVILVCYNPLPTILSPCVARIPRTVTIHEKTYTIFTANIVTWSRTALVIPTAICLKYDYTTAAFLLVLLNVILDDVDGAVARVQNAKYGQVDDPILGGFMDAFCDKIVVVLSLWSILMVTDFKHMNIKQAWLFNGACCIIIAYECILGTVRVQDYFQAHYLRKFGDTQILGSIKIAASMEGKAKEKLEAIGLGCLCLSKASRVPLESSAGIIGVVCLFLSVCLAHASLEHKLKARKKVEDKRISSERNGKGVEY